jgi:hypothetical protein
MPRRYLGPRGVRFVVFLVILLLPGLLAGCHRSPDLAFPTKYQAVFLDNGQVFFGRLGDVGSAYLSLHEVYYIQRRVAPDKKEAKNLLMPLGSEWHAPDFMRINARHIVYIEPVAPDSRVARLIREAKRHPAAASSAPPPAAGPPAKSPPAKSPKTGPAGR